MPACQPEIFIILIAAMLGACMGSFLNAAAYRSVRNLKWWGSARSQCDNCGRILTPLELIPVFSFIFIKIFHKGRCKSCGAEISARYLITELLCAAGSALLAYKFNFNLKLLALSLTGFYGAFISSLTDYETGDVFDLFALITGILGLIIRLSFSLNFLYDGLLGAVTGWAVFAFIILITRGGMGWGDAVFMAGMGAVLGLKFILIAIYLGFMLGGLSAVILLLLKKVKFGRGDTLPLVPYLSAGCFLTLLFGEYILEFINIYIYIK